MQKICSVNELRATFMFRPSFIPAPTDPGPAGYVLYTKSADQQCSILLQDYTALTPDASQRRPPIPRSPHTLSDWAQRSPAET